MSEANCGVSESTITFVVGLSAVSVELEVTDCGLLEILVFAANAKGAFAATLKISKDDSNIASTKLVFIFFFLLFQSRRTHCPHGANSVSHVKLPKAEKILRVLIMMLVCGDITLVNESSIVRKGEMENMTYIGLSIDRQALTFSQTRKGKRVPCIVR
jgi:hypothetical protein